MKAQSDIGAVAYFARYVQDELSMEVSNSIDVTAAIIRRRKDGRYLLTERKPGDFNAFHWEFPGGKRESGETLEACMARELREELGVEAEVDGFLGVFLHQHKGTEPISLHAYLCSIISGKPYGREGNNIGWYSLKEMEDLPLMEVDIEVLNELRQQ